MNGFERVTRWVEYKIGRVLTKDINEKIKKCDSLFDVDKHAKMLFESHFSQDRLKAEFLNENFNLNFESDDFNSVDGYSQYSSGDDQYDFQALTLDNIILGLQSPYEEEKLRALEALESSPIEELIVHTSWTMACKILQDILKSSDSERLANQVLKLFHRFLSSNDSPRAVSEGFIYLTENITYWIEVINRHEPKEIFHDIYDFRENKWMFNRLSSHNSNLVKKSETEIIFKSMWLLLLSQKSMPLKWSRFNEKRLKDIIFSFIHMLSSSSDSEDKNYLSGLEILSILDPKASWCNHWCHGATGRTLFCSAIKSHKNFLSHIVDFILIAVKNEESSATKLDVKADCDFIFKLPPLKEDCKAGNKKDNFITIESDMKSNGFHMKEKFSRTRVNAKVKDEKMFRDNQSECFLSNDVHYKDTISEINSKKSNWVIGEISKEIVKEAKLCHFISLIACLIRYRGGRSLFPVEITSGIRINLSDFVPNLINYIDNNIISSSEKKTFVTNEYQNHMLKIVNILKSV